MAKIIDALLIRFRMSRIEKLASHDRFLTDYARITLAHRNAKRDLARERRQTAQAITCRPLAIRAGIDTELIQKEKATLKTGIETRFHWKELAIRESARRAIQKHPERESERLAKRDYALERLEGQKQAAIQKAWDKYRPDETNREQHQADYQAKQTALEQASSLYESQLASRYIRQDAAFKTRIAKQQAAFQKAIQKHKQAVEGTLLQKPQATQDLPAGVLLRLEGLTMRFGGLVAVDDLSFDVKEGEIFGLIGPNGAGKTTVFNCITKFYRPNVGRMIFRKNPVEVILLNDFPVHRIIRQGIVRTFQNVELIWELSVIDNLLVAAHSLFQSGFFRQLLQTRKLRQEEMVLREKAIGILTKMGLAPYMNQIPYGLPYGILKKIELARTLMVEPRMIILDEPAAGLNDQETLELARMIREIRDMYHVTIFLVEHDMGLVMDICDTVAAISFGKLLAVGTPKEIQANKVVRDAYLGEA